MKSTGVAKQVRGSSLLLVGRVLSMGLNLVTQVLIVRTLTKSEYGAFAYALAVAGFVEPLITLGLHRGASRFLSIYLEEHDVGRLFGTLVLGVGTILSLGLGATLVVIGLGEVIGDRFTSTEGAVAILGILILMAPIDALDGLVESGFAVLARPRAIFIRKHVVAPLLRLAVVALLVLADEGPRFLAAGYIATGAAAVAFYGLHLVRLLDRRGLIAEVRQRGLVIPVREVLRFTISLLSADLVFLFITASSTMVLGAVASVAAVASYQAVLAPARLNYRIVTSSFTLLFTPEASRLHARGDLHELSELYWQTASWIAVLSFPVFVLTTALARPLTRLFYGERYASAAIVMALLAVGYFLNAALGFNGHTLQITGHLKTVFRINVAAVVVNVVSTVALASWFGAAGAAAATAATFAAQNLLNQIGLRRHLGIPLVEARAGRIYARVIAATVVLGAIDLAWRPPFAVEIVLAAAITLAVLRTSRHDLDVDGTFPELRKLPGLGLLLGAPRPTAPVGAPPADQEG
jgi:O-antigen/teichoic acid export membrane protein